MLNGNQISERLYKDLFHNSEKLGIIADSDLCVVAANKAASDALGLNKENFRDWSLNTLLSKKAVRKIRDHIQKPPFKDNEITFNCSVNTFRGKEFPADIKVTIFSSGHQTFAELEIKPSTSDKTGDIDGSHLPLLRKNIADITNTLELKEVLNTILTNLAEHINADKGLTLIKSGDILRIQAQYGFEQVQTEEEFPLQDEVAEKASKSSERIYTVDSINVPVPGIESFLNSCGIRSYCGVPVNLRQKFEGLLIIAWNDKHVVSRQESVLAATVSEYCSLAILNNRLFNETKNLKEDLETKFRKMPIGCIVWNRDLQVESWNPEAEKIFGYKESEAQGKDVFELITPDEARNELINIHEQLLTGVETDHRETSNITRTGKTIFCEWSSTPLKDSEGNIRKIISMVKDITEKKQLNEQLRDRLEQLTKKTRYEEAIRNISSGVHKSINTDEIMDNAAELIYRNISRADTVAIYLVEDDEAVIHSYRGYPEWFIQKVKRIPKPKGFTWRTILEGRPRYVDDVEKDDAIGQAGRDVGTKSYIAIPLKHESGVVGVININSFSTDAFTQDEMNFFETMATHIEIAISNARKVEQIKQNELRFSSFMDNLPGAVFIKDTEGRYVYINKKFQDEFDMKPEEILNKTDPEIWPPEIAQQFIENDRLVLETRKDTNLIEETLHNNKRQSWIVNKFLLYKNEREPEYIAGIAIDVTERNEAFRRVREQAKLLDIASDAIIVMDMDGRIRYWNKSSEKMYGWSDKEVMGTRATEILTPKPELFDSLVETVKTEGEWLGELRHKTKSGKSIEVESRWTLVRDEDDEPKSIFIVNTDVSDKKYAEKQLMHAQRMESLGTLAGGIAHDLNNVLQPILMSLQLLRSAIGSGDKANLQWIDILEDSANRGASLVNQVLSFARGSESEQSAINPVTFLKELTKVIRQTFPKSIQLETHFDEDIWDVSANITKLHQVIMNLCVNARDAMPDGGILTIRVENQYIDENYASMNIDASAGPYVAISVADTGAGISEDTMEKIFDPFFTTKETGKGTGLGLSIAFSIVKDHGGFIRTSSEVGKGTEFIVYLPAVEHPQINELKPVRQDNLPKGQGETVLLVDDESSVIDITKLTLEMNGYNVITARDGAEAIAAYMNSEIETDVVIMDMMMPVMDGASSIRTLHRINPDIKIIASSGFSEDHESYSKLSDVKVHEYLSKPYSAETLLKTIKRVLSNQ